MSLKNAVVKSGATIAPTGGSDLTFADSGSNGSLIVLNVPADTTFALRRTMQGSYKMPIRNKALPGGFSHAKANLAFRVPKLLADGTYDYGQVKISVDYPQEVDDAFKTELLVIGAQMLTDADFLAFWKALNTA